MERFTFIASCIFGLESVTAGELRRIGAEDVRAFDGRVEFSGGEEMLARANLHLRTAERVLIKLGEFPAATFTELFDGVKSLPLERFIGKKDAFPVKGHTVKSALHSIPDCQKIVKKAAVDRLSSVYGVNWFEETGPVHPLQFLIIKDRAILSMDTSGAPLHKRGYRKNSLIAPIKETLAAGILDLSRVKGDSLLYDPFCGSGTFLIEGALRALRIPPGINRRFGAQDYACFSKDIWRKERERGITEVNREGTFRAYGSDISGDAVALTRENAKKAGVSSRIIAEQKDIGQFLMPEKGMVVCNPPYGERLLDQNSARKLYTEMGKRFSYGDGKSLSIITPDEAFEEYFGHKASKKRKLYNGMIRCVLYLYF